MRLSPSSLTYTNPNESTATLVVGEKECKDHIRANESPLRHSHCFGANF